MTYGQYAIALLRRLVVKAADDGVLCSPNGPLKLGASLGQQLQESGFLDVLPQVLNAAADSLQGIAATAASRQGEVRPHADAAHAGGRDQGPAATGGTSTAAESQEVGGSSVQSGSRAHSVNTRPHLTTASAQDDSNMLQQWLQEARAASWVLHILHSIGPCWQQHVFVRRIAPACSAPTVHLALVLLQHVSHHLSCADQVPSNLDCYADIWLAAAHVAAQIFASVDADSFAKEQSLAATVTSRLPPHLEALVNSPHLLPCLCLCMAMSAYSSLLLQLPALPVASGGASSDSSSSSTVTLGPLAECTASPVDCSPTSSSRSMAGSSQSGKKKKKTSNKSSGNRQSNDAPAAMASLISNPMQAWQIACSQHHLLPASHEKLLHLLGSSSKVLLWGAAAGAGQMSKETFAQGPLPKELASMLASWYCLRFHQFAGLYWHLVKHHITSVGMQGLQGLQQCLNQPAAGLGVAATEQDRWWPFEQQLHYLIPTLLLYWAVHQPATIITRPDPVDCADVLSACAIASGAVRVGPDKKLEHGKRLMSQLSKQLSAAEQERLQAVLQHTASATPPACHVPQDVQLLVHQELLPLAAQAARQLLAQADSKLAGSSTGATASGNCSSTGSMQATAVFSRGPPHSAWAIIQLLSNLNGHSVDTAAQQVLTQGHQAEGTTMQGSSTAAVQSVTPESALRSWAPHAALFCQLMEFGLRCSEDVPDLSDSIPLLACQGGRGGPTGLVIGSVGPLLIQASAAKPGSLAAPSSPQQPPTAAVGQSGVQPDQVHADTRWPAARHRCLVPWAVQLHISRDPAPW